MGYLKGIRSYLAGPIEYDPDHNGGNWRVEPSRIIKEMGVDLFDPSNDDKQKMVGGLHQALEIENYEEAVKIAKDFVQKDLTIVSHANFIVAFVPQGVPTIGTVHEIIFSDRDKKPTLLVCPQGKKKTGKWYFGIIPHKYIFGSWTELYAYLKEVDEGKHKDDRKWAYTYGLI